MPHSGQDAKTEAKLHAIDYLQVLRNRWKEALLCFLLVFASCAVMTYLTPPTYSSSIRFEIKQPRAIVNMVQQSDDILSNTESPQYVATQFEVLVSEVNLMAVARKLNLCKEWQVDEAAAARRLMGMVAVMPVRGTDLVDMKVISGDPQVAKRICEGVVECYRELREARESDLIEMAIKKIHEVLQQRADILAQKTEVLRTYIQSGRYVRVWDQSGSSAPITIDNEEAALEAKRSQASALEDEITTMISHVNELQKLRDDELLGYVTRAGLLSADNPGSAMVRTLYEEYKEEESSHSQMLMNGYGPKHPRVLALDKKHEETKAKLNTELVGTREAMQNLLRLKRANLDLLKKELEQAKLAFRSKNMDDQAVMNALQDYQMEKKRYDDLENKYIAETIHLRAPRPILYVHSNPVEAPAPSSPNVKLNLTVGAILGLIVGGIVAFILDYMDTSVKTLEDVERHLELPVLGVIPQDVGLLMAARGNSPDAEAYRILRTNIELKRGDSETVSIALVSANAGEGKSTTLSNLGYVFAQAGYSTLMIDADLRRSRLADYNNVDSRIGLSNFLTSELNLQEVVLQTHVDNLYILPSGPTPVDASGVLNSYRMTELLDNVRRRFDIVLIDSPPILGVSDASLLVNKADAVLLVMQPRKLPIKVLLRAKSVIQNAGGRLMGVVMNNVDLSGDTQYQYYTTYYSYYSPDESRPKEESMIAPAMRPMRRSTAQKDAPSSPGDDLY